METKLIIFDMDGLMFNTERIGMASWSKGMEEQGFEAKEEVYINLMGTTLEDSNKLVVEHYGEEVDIPRLNEITDIEFENLLVNGKLKKNEGLNNLLDYLDEKGIKKAIASSSVEDTILRYLDMTGLSDRFDFIIGGNNVKKSKPNPEIFLNVCRNLNIPEENTYVLEDSLNGVRAAYNGNIRCIFIPDLYMPNDEIKRKTMVILDNLNEVIDYLEEN